MIAIEEFQQIIDKTLPGFLSIVRERTCLGHKSIMIMIAASNYEINGVKGQYPQCISLSHSDDESLVIQHFGGMGGQTVFCIPDKNNDREKYLAMAGMTVPFRKPKNTKDSILKAFEKFLVNYKQTLIAYRERLMYKEFVDYDAILA